MTQPLVSGPLPVEFFIQGYRISGYVSTRAKSVADMLNDRLSSYLHMQDVYISRINNPGEIVAAYPQGRLRKDNLLFAIVPTKESLAKATRSVSYFGRQRLPVWLAVSDFEIEGDLETTGRSFDPDQFLAESTGTFISISNGTARSTSAPEASFGGEVFLVNKNCIDLFCLNEGST